MVKLKESEFLNAQNAAQFLGISKSALYKLTSKGKIKFYKPSGKLIYFFKDDLVNYITSENPNDINQTKREI